MGKPWKIVIVGGGFGGLNAAQQLKSDRVDVTLIDRRNYHFVSRSCTRSRRDRWRPAKPLRRCVRFQTAEKYGCFARL